MAKIGLKYPCYSAATETDSAITYGTGAVLAKAISANISIENNDVKTLCRMMLLRRAITLRVARSPSALTTLYDAAKVALLGLCAGRYR